MSAKINSSEIDVNKNKTANIQENFSIFNVDERKSFPKFCKQTSEVNFQSKNLQISGGSNKFGKSVFCLSNNILYGHSVLLIILKRQTIKLIWFSTFYIT